VAIVLRIDLASSVPVYEQIANGLRAELVSGQFSPGDKLPPVRMLALDLGVHHNTVAEAYRQLASHAHSGKLVAKALGEGLSRNGLAREMMESAKRLQRGTI
jgi:GntR family transcriptional regulator